MNQKTGTQIMAAFMVLTMVLSVFVVFFSGNNTNPNSSQANTDNGDDYYNVKGKQVFHSFNSLEDALRMSTPDTYSAQFIDFERTRFVIQSGDNKSWNELLPATITTIRTLKKSDLDNLYSTPGNVVTTRKMYISQLPDEKMIVMSTMTPKRVFFEYVGMPSSDNQYLLLLRNDGRINVMGEPTILSTSKENVEAILSNLESWAVQQTAYDSFSPVLNYSDDYSEYQAVNSKVDFAQLFYIGIHRNNNGSFTRTTIYKDPSQATVNHVKDMAKTAADRNFFQYDVSNDKNIMKVVMTGEFSLITDEVIN